MERIIWFTNFKHFAMNNWLRYERCEEANAGKLVVRQLEKTPKPWETTTKKITTCRYSFIIGMDVPHQRLLEKRQSFSSAQVDS